MSATVMLVGFQDQGNLGIGYLASSLIQDGYSVEIIDFREKPEMILALAKSSKPILIGFSLIFQYYLPELVKLAAFLRAHGINCHFSTGGHYPTLCYQGVLEAVPELDSVVRFEGELTLLELVNCLKSKRDWSEVTGIAFRRNQEIFTTPLRPLVHDLDQLPYPYRHLKPEHVLGKQALPLLASRGCVRTCSFCSIHMFYRSAPGKVVRTRMPSKIVEEMKGLFDQGVSIFLFQDDDFPLWDKPGRRWVLDLVEELYRADLVGKAIWKISCRADHVEEELFATLKDAGLYLVYMGLESGTDSGLKVLNKHITVEQNLNAVSILKKLGLIFEYGFMLFDPSSTFQSVRENISFLRKIVGDGCTAATFCRMLPYGGTPIRDQLEKEGRLKGNFTRPDYDFLDLRLNTYHEALDKAVGVWIHGDGVSHQLNWAWHEVGVIERLFPTIDGIEDYKELLRSICISSNNRLFTIVEESAHACENGADPCYNFRNFQPEAADFIRRLMTDRNQFIARNQDSLLAALAHSHMTGPVVSPQIF